MTAIPKIMLIDGVPYDVKLTRRYPTPEELGRLAQSVQAAAACEASLADSLQQARAEATGLEVQYRGASDRYDNARVMLALRVEGFELVPHDATLDGVAAGVIGRPVPRRTT